MTGIGIDTGGTCTDAVIYDFETKEILATGKTLTTKENLEIGIANALDQLKGVDVAFDSYVNDHKARLLKLLTEFFDELERIANKNPFKN